MTLHTFELDVDSLLSEEDKIEIIKDEYRKVIRQVVNVDKERIFSNAAYHVVQKLVDEVFGEDLNEILVEKVKNIIKDLSSYTVFKKQDAWERDESKGWGYLQAAIESQEQAIHSRVQEIVENYLTTEVQEDTIHQLAQDAVYRVIQDRLIGKENK